MTLLLLKWYLHAWHQVVSFHLCSLWAVIVLVLAVAGLEVLVWVEVFVLGPVVVYWWWRLLIRRRRRLSYLLWRRRYVHRRRRRTKLLRWRWDLVILIIFRILRSRRRPYLRARSWMWTWLRKLGGSVEGVGSGTITFIRVHAFVFINNIKTLIALLLHILEPPGLQRRLPLLEVLGASYYFGVVRILFSTLLLVIVVVIVLMVPFGANHHRLRRTVQSGLELDLRGPLRLYHLATLILISRSSR